MIASYRSAILSLLLLCCTPIHASKWDLEYWQLIHTTNWEQDPYKVYTQVEMRTHDDLHKFYYYHLTEALAYKVCSWLTLEAHYTYLYEIPTGDTKFANRNRLELEFNPSLELYNGLKINWRNRYELIKQQKDSKLKSVFRHRTVISTPLEDRGNLKAISISDEFFFDFNQGKFTQNRFFPITLTFSLPNDCAIDCFLMVRNFLQTSINSWHNSIVIGSDFGF